MRRIHILLLLLLCAGSTPSALGQSRMLLGLNGGAMALIGGDGFLFRDANTLPHREWGWSAGLSLYIPLARDLHVITGLSMQQEYGHFHLDREGGNTGKDELPTGTFLFRYFQVPITLNHMGLPKGRNQFVLKEFFGFAFNYGNLLDPLSGELEFSDYTYVSQVSQPTKITPEFLIGAGLSTRQLKFGYFHYQASLHIDLLKNQRYEASINNPVEGIQETAVREMRGVKAMISVIFFPMIQLKRNKCYR